MSNKRDLRRLIRNLLEAAVVSKTAASQGLALYRKQTSNNVEYVLYDPEVFTREIKTIQDDYNGNAVGSDVLGSIDPSNIIVGYLNVKPHNGDCWDAAEVKFSAAQKGYGPLMYELAMSDYGKLMSDHGAGTSASARNVWQKYNQRSDIKKLPFDDVKNPKTPPKGDDCKLLPDFDGDIAYLNQAYAGQGDASGKEALMHNHQTFIKDIVAKGYKAADVELAVRMLGDEYFGGRYRDQF